MTTNISKNDTVGALVAQDYRTAAVFEQYGIDFCCNGKRSIEEACKKAGVSEGAVLDGIRKKITESDNGARSGTDYNSWPLDLLAEYVEKKHHRYVSTQIPVLQAYLLKLSSRHGDRHPELHEIHKLFNESAGELTMHMKKEELMLFPFIKRMVDASQSGNTLPKAPFGTVQNPVAAMMDDHDGEGERFRRIAELSDNYMTPADGCNTYRVTYALLKEYESDLHLHIHLENNILFPKAIELERSFSN